MNVKSAICCSRRQVLHRFGTGLGVLGLAALMGQEGLLGSGASAAEAKPVGPLAPKPTHFPAKAKHVIHIYLNGGPSQVDTFDPKPLLAKYEGQKLPTGNLTTERPTGAALASPFKFNKYGTSGLEIAEIFANLGKHADDLCVVRSMYANTPNHEQSMRLMNCGDERLSRPSYGAWITYGMGTENQNLPGYVAMCPDAGGRRLQLAGAFLPGIYQERTSTRTKPRSRS
jgi:hypothetical protein